MDNSKSTSGEIEKGMPPKPNAPNWTNLTYDGRTITAECSAVRRYKNYWLYLYLKGGSKPETGKSRSYTKVTYKPLYAQLTAQLQWLFPDRSKRSNPSYLLNLVMSAPDIQQAYFDGECVIVSWTNKSQVPTGGIITIRADNKPITTKTVRGCSGKIPLKLDISKSYVVQVTAATGDLYEPLKFISKGPPSAPVNVVAPVRYCFPDATSAPSAYIFRGILSEPAKHDIALYLPNIFTKSPDPAKISEGSFIVEKTQSTTFPYVLKIAESSIAWQFGSESIRGDLKTEYLTFLKNLEDTSLCELKPGALALVRYIIARGLPLTFAETLYYSYGFNPEHGYINIQPGMRLRIDYQGHQMVGPDLQDRYLNGFVGTGSGYHDIGSYLYGTSDNIVKTGFDSFLTLLKYTVDPNEGGAGGIVDVTGNSYRRPYYRLFYPSKFTSSDSPGAVGDTNNVAVFGADSYSDLETATDIYIKNVNNVENLKDRDFYGARGISTFFRGRVVIVPEILCFVQSVPTYVPVGTTVRQLIERLTSLPMAEDTVICDLEHTRSIGNVVDRPITPNLYSIGCSNPVNFNHSPLQTYRDGKTYFDLPVLHGDSLTYRIEG